MSPWSAFIKGLGAFGHWEVWAVIGLQLFLILLVLFAVGALFEKNQSVGCLFYLVAAPIQLMIQAFCLHAISGIVLKTSDRILFSQAISNIPYLFLAALAGLVFILVIALIPIVGALSKGPLIGEVIGVIPIAVAATIPFSGFFEVLGMSFVLLWQNLFFFVVMIGVTWLVSMILIFAIGVPITYLAERIRIPALATFISFLFVPFVQTIPAFAVMHKVVADAGPHAQEAKVLFNELEDVSRQGRRVITSMPISSDNTDDWKSAVSIHSKKIEALAPRIRALAKNVLELERNTEGRFKGDGNFTGNKFLILQLGCLVQLRDEFSESDLNSARILELITKIRAIELRFARQSSGNG